MPKFLRHVQFPPHPPAIPTLLRHTHSPLSEAQEGHGSRGLIPLMHTIKSFQTFFFFNENKLNPSTKWKRCFSHMFLLWCKIYLKQYYIITVWQHPFQTWHQEKIIDSICSKDNQKKKDTNLATNDTVFLLSLSGKDTSHIRSFKFSFS